MDGAAAHSVTTDGAPVYHGGGLAVARDRFPGAPEPWIDLSTGINPVPYPVDDIPSDAWTRLPEAAAVAALEHIAAGAYGVDDAAMVAATPGTQALIEHLPRLVPTSSPAPRVHILGFTYQEHAHVWRRAGAQVDVVETLEALSAADIAIVVNPNNPDGRHVAPERLAMLAVEMGARGGSLIVDQAFADVLPPDAGIEPFMADPAVAAGTLVLRSFGKAYGLAGLRLGFLVADPVRAARTRALFGPWAVSGPAITLGGRALADRVWLDAATRRLEADRARLEALLTGAGLAIVGGTPLFVLARTADATSLFERLAHRGILVRPFPARPDWLRFGLPGDAVVWDRLAAALAARG
ncbi:threonine-phosphate decarboxylase CobD [Methyloraptor flagellatus]|uniref:threonine-phosphate decarboxylase n=1 Tax=Methyloraptor flagellatus TaxID=3162530 RepID=A0AAU7XBR8_9HYPH